MNGPKRLLGAGEVADQLHLSVSAVYKLVERREIECVRVTRGSVRFRQEQVDEFIASRRVPVAGAE